MLVFAMQFSKGDIERASFEFGYSRTSSIG
jgi:hypothetical protein